MSIKTNEETVSFEVKATPSASRTEIVGVQEGALRIRVAAAPEDGKANAELRAFLAKRISCPKSSVALVKGEKSRLKTFSVPAEYKANVDRLFEIPTTK